MEGRLGPLIPTADLCGFWVHWAACISLIQRGKSGELLASSGLPVGSMSASTQTIGHSQALWSHPCEETSDRRDLRWPSFSFQ